MAENQPGLGRGAGSGDRAGSVTAGFKVDTKSLDNLNKLWERLVQNVRNFNAELKKIDGKAMDRYAVGMSGVPGMGGRGVGGSLSAGQFSLPPGMGRTQSGLLLPNGGFPPVKTAGGGGGGGTQQPQGNGGDAKFSAGKVAGYAGLAAVGTAAAYGNSHRQNWVDSQRLSQLTAWGGSYGTGDINSTMTAARHSWFGGGGYGAGLTGYTSVQDAFAGLQTIRDQQGLSMSPRSRSLQQSAGRAGNLLGSYAEGAQAATGFYSPQAYYNLMPLGVKTIGTGGVQQSPEAIAQQLLKRIYGGRMPTSKEVNEGRAQGSNMRATMNSLGLDASTQEFVYSYGETANGRSPAAMQSILSKTGKGGTSALGDTVFDADRRKAQEKAQIEADLGDSALPQLQRQVNATTKAFQQLNGVMGGPLGSVLGTGSAAAGPIMGAFNSASQFGGGLAGMYLMNKFLNNRAAGPGAGTGMLGALRGGGGLARGLRGGAGGLIGYTAGGMASSVIPGASRGSMAARGALKYGATGAGIGAMAGMGLFSPEGAAIGGGIGALAGGALGLMGMGGAGGTGSVEEIDAITAGLGRTMGSTGAALGNQDTGGSTTGGAMDGAPAGVSTGVGTARGAAADAWMERQSRSPAHSWFDRCLEAVRTSLGAPGGVKSAAVSFAATKNRHNGTPPPGVPVWWTGGAYGHVALSAGGGMVWSNDILRRGQIDKVPISLITKKWGKQYQGWSEDINGVDVYNPSGGSAGGTSGIGATSHGAMSPVDVFKLARQAGFSRDAAVMMTAISGGESGWHPGQHNPNASTGDNSYGLWQINMLGGLGPERRRALGIASNDALYNPATNARAAWMISNHGQSFTPWSVYKHGSYRPFLAQAQAAARSVPSYDQGAYEIHNDQYARIHKGEMVVPARSAKRVRDYVKRGANTESAVAAVAGGGGRGVTVHMSVTINVPAGTTQAQAKYIVSQMASQLESDARISAVMGGD